MTPVALKHVPESYRHYVKQVTPGEPLMLPGVVFKWYDIAPADQPVPAETRDLARAQLARDQGRMGLDGELGFVILHRCGEGFYFLLVQTWRGANEMWETVWFKNGAEMEGFDLWPQTAPHRATFCVWELAAVWTEQQAWTRFLDSPRGQAEQAAWLADTAGGPV